LLLSTLTQQLLSDAADETAFERGLADVLSTVGTSDSDLDFGAVLDVASGTLVQRLPTRSTVVPPAVEDLEGVGVGDLQGQRVVPLEDGSWGLVHSVPVQRLGRQLVVVVGSVLDDRRATQIARTTGVDGVEIVVEGGVVAASAPGAVDRAPLGDPGLQRQTQELPDGRLVRYVAVGADRVWGEQAAIGLVTEDPLTALDARLARTRMLMVTVLVGLAGILAFALARVMTRPIVALTRTATAIAGGDLERSFAVERNDEIGVLAGALERMRRALRAQLLVIRDQAQALQEAARRIVEVQDEERRRVAQDLHDGIQQRLVVLRMQVGAARHRLREQPEVADEVADDLAASIDAILDELRATGQALFPSILRDRGLGGALHSLAARSATPVDVVLEPDPLPRCDEVVEINAYFLVSEAVTNALKHADAERIRVTARHERDWLRLTVVDDGVGFRPDRVSGGGVTHLRDRVNALGGSLQVVSGPGEGTSVTALLPLQRSVAGALEVEEHGGDPTVQRGFLGEAELPEDGVDVLLDRPVRDRQLPGDGEVPPPGRHQ
jgi:signal transduction histidine kinase